MAMANCESTFPIGRFHQFLIRDLRKRVITPPCFDEPVLHHAIMNQSDPTLDRWLKSITAVENANVGGGGVCVS